MLTDELDRRVRGVVRLPGQDGYELHGFNTAVPQRPRLVVEAAGTEDIVAAVRFAGDHDLPVGVQATGHGVSGPVDDGLVISTQGMTGVVVDPRARLARVSAGTRWDEVIQAAGVHGLAPLNGSSPLVGVVGYTSGGGLGPLGRKYGYAADHVRSFDIVLADGRHETVTPEHLPELFWAVRGGKSNFGVVTSMVFELMPVDRLYGGGLWFQGADAERVLHVWRKWVDTVPDELTSSLALVRLPKLMVHVRVAYTGEAQYGEQLVAPLRAVAEPSSDTVTVMPYTSVARIHEDATQPLPHHERNLLLRELDRAAVDTLLAVAGPDAVCDDIMVELRHLGGALAREPAVLNAVGNREANFCLTTLSAADRPSDAVLRGMVAYGTGRRYLNFLAGPLTAGAVRDAYEPDMYRRLRAVKSVYDSRNLFRLNHNIPPVEH